jgi:hypothetical protein
MKNTRPIALLSLSAAALKCGDHDRWIGWDFTSTYGRLIASGPLGRVQLIPFLNHLCLGAKPQAVL